MRTLERCLRRVRYYIQDILYQVRRVQRFIRRMWDYAPVLWDNDDGDWGSILPLLRYKLIRMRNTLSSSMITSQRENVHQITQAIYLLDRLMAGDYCEEEHVTYDTKWGKLEVSDGGIHPARAKTEREKRLASQELGKIYEREHQLYEKDWRQLWRLLRLHMRSWWD